MKKLLRKVTWLLLVCLMMSLVPVQAETLNVALIGETEYATLEAALSAAQQDDVVKLLQSAQQEVLIVNPSVILDLNGNTLQAEYVIGMKDSAVIDSSAENTGKLKAAQNCVALDGSNGGYLPVYATDSYIFTTVNMKERSMFAHASKFVFSPLFESFAHSALAAGETASGVRVVIRLHWTSAKEGNYEAQQDFFYLDKMVKDVIDSFDAAGFANDYALAFAATFNDRVVGRGNGVRATAVVQSATGVEIAGITIAAPETPSAEELEMAQLLENKTKLRFNEDGEFKALVLADLHTKAGGLTAVQQQYIKTMVDREEPDLVILTGDNVRSLPAALIPDEAAMRVALDSMVSYLEEKGIYWMHVYGNHDDEDNPLDKETQQAIYESYEYCLSKDVEELSGVGNYVVPLYASDESKDEIKFAFWGLDSGSYMTEEDKAALFQAGGTSYNGYSGTIYDYIHYDQIRWYENTSARLENYTGGKVPGLMAFHIPLQEFNTAWNNRESLNYTGDKNESICAGAYNSGLYDAMRNRGDIKAVVSGHDHKNTFMVEYGGIKLCYSPTMSTNSYYDEKEMGARVFVLNEQEPADVDTYISYLQERPDYTMAEPIEDGYAYDFEGDVPTITKSGNGGWTGADLSTIAVSVKDGIGKDGSKGLATMRTGWNADTVGARSIQLIWDMPFGKVGDNKYLAVWVDFATNNVKLRKGSFGVVVDGNYSTHYETDANDTVSDFYVKGQEDATWQTMQTDRDGCMVGLEGFKGWIAVPLEAMRQVSTGASLTADSVITGLLVFNAPASEDMVNKEYYYDQFTFVKDYKSVSPDMVLVTDFEGDVPTIRATGNAGNTSAHLDKIDVAVKEGVGRNGSKGLSVKRTAWDSTAGKVGLNSIQLIWDIEPMKKGDNEYLAVWVDFETNQAELRIGCFGVIVDDNYTGHYETDAYDKICEFYTKAEGATEWTTQKTNSDGCMVSLKGFKGWIAVPLSTMEQYRNTENFLNADSNITGLLVFNAPNYAAMVNKEYYYDDFMFVKDYNDID